MNGTVVVRPADSVEERRAVRRIRHRVFVVEQGIPAALDADGRDDDAYHLLACADGRPVATGRLIVTGDRRGALGRIAVLPDWRGAGLGRSIVAGLEDEARRRGLDAVTLEPHARLEGFYRELGYATVPGRSRAGRHELITMQKRLRGRVAD